MYTHRRNGLARVDVIIIVCLIFMVFAPLACRRSRSASVRTMCGRNLSSIGKAALTYATDYNGELPHIGGENTFWGRVTKWDAISQVEAFGLDNRGGLATVSASLYLLVKYCDIEPRTFICGGDVGAVEFRLRDETGLPPGFDLQDAWDFGPKSWRHCSYSYHIPYAGYHLTTSHEPGMAIVSDRNPWIMSPGAAEKAFTTFTPDIQPWSGSEEQARNGNTITHGKDGQNVFFLDGHGEFAKRAYCGVDQDNVFTTSDMRDGGSPLGGPPTPGAGHIANPRDSLLVHDPDVLPGPWPTPLLQR